MAGKTLLKTGFPFTADGQVIPAKGTLQIPEPRQALVGLQGGYDGSIAVGVRDPNLTRAADRLRISSVTPESSTL